MGRRSRGPKDPYKLRGLFRREPAHMALPKALSRLLAKMGRPQAVHVAVEAADAWGRRPTAKQLLEDAVQTMFAAGVSGSAGLEAVLGVLYCLHRWYGTDPRAASLAGGLLLPVMTQADYVIDRADPVRIRVLTFGGALLGNAREEELARTSVTVRGQLAAAWHATGDETGGRKARDLLRESLEDAQAGLERAETAEDKAEWQVLSSQTVANLGQQLTSMGERDPVAYLDTLVEALRLHDQALSDAARRADPVRHYHSLRMRASTRRLLTLASRDDLAVALAHLEAGVRDVEEAIRLWHKHQAVRPIDHEGIFLNRVNLEIARLRLRVLHADIEPAELRTEGDKIRAELDRLARTRHPGVRPLVEQSRSAIRGVLGAPVGAPDAEALRATLDAAGREASVRERGPSQASLLAVLAQLQSFADHDELLPEWAWPRLGPTLGHFDVGVVGIDVAERAAQLEIALLLARVGARPGSADVYLDQAIEDLERRLASPIATSTELRLFSAWLGKLAYIRLYSVGVDATGEWLVLNDRLGSSAYRALSILYGVDEVGDWKDAEDARWRTHLYRARWERDFAGWVLEQLARISRWERGGRGLITREQLLGVAARAEVHPGHLPEHIIASMAEGRPYERSVDGWVISTQVDEATARRELADLRAELHDRWAAGHAQGWKPADHDDSPPRPDAQDIEGWLAANPGTVLLVAGVGLHVVRGARVVSLEEEHQDEIIEVVSDYLQARAEFSWGGGESGQGHHAAATALDEVLARLLDVLGHRLDALLNWLGGVTSRVVVLARSVFRELPWGALPLGERALGQQAEVVHLDTLAEIPVEPRRDGHVVAVIGSSSTAVGSALGTLERAMSEGIDVQLLSPDRETTERALERAAEVHVLAHGQVIPMAPDASGIVLDEHDDKPQNRLSSSEIRQMDLRGVRPVCLWACNSAKSAELPDGFLDADEPGALDMAFLLAGAHVVIGSLWLQYGVSTAMIAADFLDLRRQYPGVPEATLLWRSIAAYRTAVAPDGPVFNAIRQALSEGDSLSVALEGGMRAWRRHRALDEAPDAAPEGLGLLGRVVPTSATNDTEAILRALRSPVAWAGWRVLARSKEVL